MTRSCAIIGAGPAGSAAAALLARAGWRVDVFEKARFPRAKVCGEFISPAATDLLEGLICARDLEAMGARRCAGVAIEAGRRETRWRLPRPGWALSRATLDHALLARAADAGAAVHCPAIVRAVRYDEGEIVIIADGAAEGECVDGAGGRRRDRIGRRADIVIHADGFGRHDPAGCIPIDTRLVAFKYHFQCEAPEPGIVRLRAKPGAYIGTIDVEHGLSTCAWVARRSAAGRIAPRCPGGEAQETPELPEPPASALGADDPETPAGATGYSDTDYPTLACPVPRSGYITPGHPRSFRIGNAAAAVDPVGGEGIGLALWSATTLAALLADLEPEGKPLLRAQSRFERLYRARLRARLPACRLAAETLMRPKLAAAMRPALDLGAIGPWSRLTGKPGRAARPLRAPVP
jgi:2-polyprenyl-6-methoxyphenol hydroxylase-like FAD-dependent oxidoreductase